MKPVLHLNEFFVEGDNEELSHVLLHIIQPSTPEEEKEKGYFFAVCEINNGDKEDIYNLQNLMDKIETEYYELPNELGKNSLETILEKINHQHFSLGSSQAELSCVIGTLRENEVVFSLKGAPQAILFYKNREGLHQKMDLISENAEVEDEEKLFPQIIQGKISPGDYFFVGSPHVSNCFTQDRLQKIITVRTPEQSAEHFNKVLSDLRSGYSYGGLIINFEAKEEDTPGQAAARAAKTGDKNTIYETEQKTARTLSPSLLSNINDRMKSMVANDDEAGAKQAMPANYPAEIRSAHMKRREKISSSEQAGTAVILKAIWIGIKYLGFGIYKILMFLVGILAALGKGLLMLFMLATNFQNRRQSILESWSANFRAFKDKVKQLPLLTKVLGIASIIFAIIFIGSLVYLQVERKQAVKEQDYQNALQLIRNKADAAESAVIYSDFDGARRESDEAKNLLGSFTCRSEDASACQDISNRLANIASKLRKMDVVAMNMVYDWNTVSGTVDKIFKINNKIIGFSSSTPIVYIYDLLTKENSLVAVAINGINGFLTASVPKENDYAILLATDKKTIVLLDPQSNSVKKADITHVSDPEITAVTVYNRRLYALDTKSNQIWRYDATKSGFGLGKEWTKDASQNIRDGVDITIDGDLFVLKSSGEIFKFTQGAKVEFTTQGIDPALQGGDEIWTYTDLNNLYILDSKEKRLIILDKTGKLVRQITGMELVAPTGAVIEEPKANAYILDSNKLYQASLKQ